MTQPRRYRKRIPGSPAHMGGATALPRPPATTRRQQLVLVLLLLLLILLGGLLAWRIWPKQVETLPASVGIRKQNLPDHVFNVWDVSRPMAVAASPDGRRIYVAETDGERAIRVFDRNGEETGKLWAPNTTPLSRNVLSLAVAPTGELYAVDRQNSQLQVFSPSGEFLRIIPPPDAQRWAPAGVAVDSAGFVYVTESLDLPEEQRHRVVVLDPEGKLVRQFGSKGESPGQLMFPYGIAVDRAGRVYVGVLNGGVEIFNPDGTFRAWLGQGIGSTGVALPQGLALSADGSKLFVVDAVNHHVVVYKIDGDSDEYLGAIGDEGDGDEQFRFPSGVATDGTGRVYVADRANGRLSVWAY